MVLTELKWSFLPKQTYFRVCSGAVCKLGRNVTIRNSRIIVTPGSLLEIGNDVCIENTVISVSNGKLTIGDYSLIGDNQNVILNIESGEINIGHHTKIAAKRCWVRFGGVLCIGNYTNINAGSEIRCDESITIGNYNQISYGVNIWDTNTHNIYSFRKRRDIAEKYYPYFGKELERPKTKPVIVGDDCWLGEKVSLLKGTSIANGVIVGYNTTLVGKYIPANSTVVTDCALKIFERE